VAFINDSIYLIRNGIFPSNTYLLKDGRSNDCIVFDPGLDLAAVEKGIKESGWKPIAIMCTHGHFDHIGSVTMLKTTFDIPYYLHQKDYKISQSANFYLKMARVEAKVETSKPDVLLNDTEGVVMVGNFEINYHLLPGHSDGSCMLQYKNYLFSGDILFEHGIGDDSIPKANMTLLRKSLEIILEQYKDADLILPGHGNALSLGDLKKGNKQLQLFLSKNNIETNV
jgi:hydroxyacylglutathione hydrolase